MVPNSPHRRVLFIRFSSLGDVLLSAAALNALTDEQSSERIEAHWLTRTEYARGFEGHPKLKRVWKFDRKTGWQGLVELAAGISGAGFDDIVDLHATLRTRALRVLVTMKSASRRPRWRVISKQRFRLWLVFLLKGLCPRAWRPTPWVRRYSELGRALMRNPRSNLSGPDLRYLAERGSGVHEKLSRLPDGYFCVMPSSLWPGKQWPIEYFADLLAQVRGVPVILGTNSDAASLRLVERLHTARREVLSGVGWSLEETAEAIRSSRGLLSGDTGLVHLAEAVGSRAFVLQGPTTSAVGFGPWREASAVAGAELWCRPCSKDGSACFRTGENRYLCMTSLRPSETASRFQQWLDQPQGRE